MIIKDAAYYKAYREKKKMEEVINDGVVAFSEKAKKIVEEIGRGKEWIPVDVLDDNLDRKSGIDHLYMHTGPNPKIKRCQAGYNGKACPNEGMPATVGEYKTWLCFMHSSMGKLWNSKWPILQ